MVKGENLGNGCRGYGSCFISHICKKKCIINNDCSCGRKYIVYKYIRYNVCPHNCQLIKCSCNEYVPQYELDNNNGLCNKCINDDDI